MTERAPKKKAGKPLKAIKNGNYAPSAKKRLPTLPQGETKPKNVGGRPAKYKTPEELQEKIDAYFDSCWIDKVTEVIDKNGTCTMSTVRYQNRPYTVAGLTLALGFATRQSLLDYDEKPGFVDIIKKAKLTIEMCWEEELNGKNAAGPIFWLKNHAGYRDTQQMVHSGPDGGAISMKLTDTTDEELLDIATRGCARAAKKAQGKGKPG